MRLIKENSRDLSAFLSLGPTIPTCRFFGGLEVFGTFSQKPSTSENLDNYLMFQNTLVRNYSDIIWNAVPLRLFASTLPPGLQNRCQFLDRIQGCSWRPQIIQIPNVFVVFVAWLRFHIQQYHKVWQHISGILLVTQMLSGKNTHTLWFTNLSMANMCCSC